MLQDIDAQYKVMDLFCGTGGFAHGFTSCENLFKLVYAIDIDPIATATAKANYPDCRVDTKDIRKVYPEVVKRNLGLDHVDVIIGGPPCQGFSSLRPHRSSKLGDERNNLYMAFASFIEFFQPKVVVMENVVGLITHDSGLTLDKVLDRFKSFGYHAEWKILNAANYGVPQKRERLILIATRDGNAVRFPYPTHHFSGKVIGHRDRGKLMSSDDTLPKALSVNDAIGDLPSVTSGQQVFKYDRDPENSYQRARRGECKILTLHKAADHNRKMLEVIKHSGDSIRFVPKHLITSGFSSSYSRLNGEEPSTTITVKFQSPASNKCIHPTQDRTLTPREAARIQSFDDSYLFKGAITRINSQIGNAVPPLLGRAIARTVSELLINC